tara:strand:- start:1947 stop:3257 length:1311 start_codon:yes stop_codon:yes gene_type:complete
MKNKINLENIDLDAVKQTSLCALPWLHIHLTPDHNIMPCCITNMENAGDIQSTQDDGIIDWMNSPAMNQMRLDMLAGKQPNACKTCYHQETSMESFRKTALREYKEFIPEALENTNEDGSIDNFKMRYLDMRFSNLCNMKCRTCCSAYSSQWEIEDAKDGFRFNQPKTEVNTTKVFQDLKDQIPNLKKAYFAGGEPLITEDHYVLLEEMIRTGRTDIILSYNTNLSKLKFKDKDLMDLWGRFKNRVQVYGSIDHYGEKAEVIRAGTKWEELLHNYKVLHASDVAHLSITTSVSIFNYHTLTDFFDYFIDRDIAPWRNGNRGAWQINPIYGPDELSFQTMPADMKEEIIAQQERWINDKLLKISPSHNMYAQVELLVSQMRSLGTLARSTHKWDEQRERFVAEVKKIDRRRGENFVTTFPELAHLYSPYLEGLSHGE